MISCSTIGQFIILRWDIHPRTLKLNFNQNLGATGKKRNMSIKNIGDFIISKGKQKHFWTGENCIVCANCVLNYLFPLKQCCQRTYRKKLMYCHNSCRCIRDGERLHTSTGPERYFVLYLLCNFWYFYWTNSLLPLMAYAPTSFA